MGEGEGEGTGGVEEVVRRRGLLFWGPAGLRLLRVRSSHFHLLSSILEGEQRGNVAASPEHDVGEPVEPGEGAAGGKEVPLSLEAFFVLGVQHARGEEPDTQGLVVLKTPEQVRGELLMFDWVGGVLRGGWLPVHLGLSHRLVLVLLRLHAFVFFFTCGGPNVVFSVGMGRKLSLRLRISASRELETGRGAKRVTLLHGMGERGARVGGGGGDHHARTESTTEKHQKTESRGGSQAQEEARTSWAGPAVSDELEKKNKFFMS